MTYAALRGPAALPLVAATLALWGGCTDADIYGRGVNEVGPDRLIVRSEICTDDTSGDRFPVKVLFVADMSQDLQRADPNSNWLRLGHPGSLSTLVDEYLQLQHVRVGFIGATSTASAFPIDDGQHFFYPDEPEVTVALNELNQPFAGSPTGRDLNTILTKVENFILTDVEESSPGEIVRSRYIVSLLMAGPPVPAVANIGALGQRLQDMLARIYALGVLEVRINVGLLYRGPRSISPLPGGYNDPCLGGAASYSCFVEDATTGTPCSLCDPGVSGSLEFCSTYCDLDAGTIDQCAMDDAREVYEAVAFATGGVFVEYPCPGNLRFEADIASSSVRLLKKDVIAFNRNVRLTPDGPVVDSDGDGLSDIEELEAATPTDPANWDSDGDALGDRTEYRTYPRQDPLDGSDRPVSCGTPLNVFDSDADLLWNCEEALLQTNPSLADTDGDGMPDALEFWSGTIPTTPDDRLLDFDADGFANAVELQRHTDPRSNDGLAGTQYAYRTDSEDIGNRDVVTMARLQTLRGLVLRNTSPNVQGGAAYLEWDACTNTLSWSDASWPAGIFPYEPVARPVPGSGDYTLTARAANGQEIWAEFRVVREFMPTCADAPAPVVERPLMKPSVRRCYDVTISNIKLMPTLPSVRIPGGSPTEAGLNEVLLFFTQAPDSRLLSPGLAKVARVPVVFDCTDPDDLATCTREPDVFEINVTEDLFVSSFQE